MRKNKVRFQEGTGVKIVDQQFFFKRQLKVQVQFFLQIQVILGNFIVTLLEKISIAKLWKTFLPYKVMYFLIFPNDQ